MSKLYEKYLFLKNQNQQKLYLFHSGIFYIALDEDAKNLSKLLGFKLVNLNASILKCGFPESKLEFYSNQLTLNNIIFEVVDEKNNNVVTKASDPTK